MTPTKIILDTITHDADMNMILCAMRDISREETDSIEECLYELEDSLREYFEGNFPEVESPYCELLRIAFNDISWYKIALTLLQPEVINE